jgi:hypothetical protein
MADIRLRPEPDERFIHVAPRHWIELVIRESVAVLIGGSLLIVLALRLLSREPDFLGRQPPLADPLNIALLVSVLAMIAIAAYVYFDWANDHLIITNKRVVHEDRTLWLSFMYEIIPLDQIQNVNIRTENFLQYMLKYGRVEVQAAGPTNPIIFKRADCPNEIQKRILAEVQRVKRSQEEKRLLQTVERRLHPDKVPPPAPPPPPRHLETVNSGLQALLPLSPVTDGSNVIIWHRHWIVLLRFLAWPALALIGWLGAFVALSSYGLLESATSGILLVVLLVIAIGFVWQYENWRNDMYILEPSKIVDLQRLPFGLFEDRREATLGVIQNVNATSPNLIARVLGYGDVLIETAGSGGNFTFDHVPDPDEVQRIVFEYVDRFKWQQREREWNNTLNIVEMFYNANQHGNSPPPAP